MKRYKEIKLGVKMGWKKCPECELNYIKDEQEKCDVCAGKIGAGGPSTERPVIRHKGVNIFMVFQGKEYVRELRNGYIRAPYKDAGGNSPSHWTMLENIKPGDIIFHGLEQCISAISVAKSTCFKSVNHEGVEVRQVDCLPIILKNTIATKQYLKVIVDTCTKSKYQPFDKNGNGRQGYLFDLNDELAGVFARAIVKKNSNIINQVPKLSEVIIL